VQVISYIELQRSDVLDYLLKRGTGAALPVLEIEIGGDAFLPCGAYDARRVHEIA
jgi:Glycosyl hydrolase family 59